MWVDNQEKNGIILGMHPVLRIAWSVACCLPAVSVLTSCDKIRNKLSDLADKTGESRTATGEWVKEIGAEEFDTFRRQDDKVVIVDFHAPWCGPCRKLAPILDEIVAEHEGAVVVGKINVDDHPELATSEGVRSIPDVRIYRNGGLVDKLVGLPPASELRRRIGTQVESLGTTATAHDKSAAGDTAEKEPEIRPMTKDWLPPGIQRR